MLKSSVDIYMCFHRVWRMYIIVKWVIIIVYTDLPDVWHQILIHDHFHNGQTFVIFCEIYAY